MDNNIKIFSKKSFTLEDFVEFTKNCNTNAIIYNSTYDVETSKKNLEDDMLHSFEKIIGIDKDDEIIAYFNYKIEPEFDGYSLRDFYNFYNNVTFTKKNKTISRDVDDGYVYDDYNNIICSDSVIILC